MSAISIEECWTFIVSVMDKVIEWFTTFEADILKKVFYLLSIYCLLLGIQELKKKKQKGKVEEPKIFSPLAVRVVEQSLHPTNQAQMLIVYEKGIKKVMKWLKNNKGAISTLLVGALTVLSYFDKSFGGSIVWLGIDVIPFVGSLATGILALTTKPFTSSTVAQFFKDAVTAYKENKVDKQLLADINFFEKSIAELEKKLAKNEKEYASDIETYTRATRYGLTITQELRARYNEYVSIKAGLEAELNDYKTKLSTLGQ